ncbi:hypothetical protein ATERTT37_007799 [Aspergillus terreus]
MTPSLDYSIYLINSVKFHAGQLYHLFDEESFMEALYAFHNQSDHQAADSQLWYIQYLLLIAFGKAFVVQRNHGNTPAGYEFFLKALQLLPDITRLSREPIIATEIGQAVRIALAQGMHTNMPVDSLGPEVVQRCRKIWWTVFILDRQMTSLMGFLPFDLESTFVSTFVLLVVPAVDPCLLDESDNWLHKCYMVLDEMISRGNRIAAYRKSELDQLSRMLGETSDESLGKVDYGMRSQLPSFLTPHSDDHAEIDGNGFTTAEIMAVAESIDIGDVDWIAHAVTENRIW